MHKICNNCFGLKQQILFRHSEKIMIVTKKLKPTKPEGNIQVDEKQLEILKLTTINSKQY